MSLYLPFLLVFLKDLSVFPVLVPLKLLYPARSLSAFLTLFDTTDYSSLKYLYMLSSGVDTICRYAFSVRFVGAPLSPDMFVL